MSKIKVRKLQKICDFSDEYGNCEKVALYAIAYEKKEYNFCETHSQRFQQSIKKHNNEGVRGTHSVTIATPKLGGIRTFAQFGREESKQKTKNLNEINFAIQAYKMWLELASLEDIGLIILNKESYKTLVYDNDNVIYYYAKNNKPAFIMDSNGRNRRYIHGMEVDIQK